MKKFFMNTNAMLAVAAATLVSSPAFAAGQIGEILTNPTFVLGMQLVFAIFTVFKWIEYFQKFKSDSAVTDAIVPLLLTFMTFQWDTVLGWFGLK